MRLILLAPLFAATCASASLGQEPAEATSETVPCYASTKEWRAWIDATPGRKGPELVVTGIVTAPTGGHLTVLTLGPTLRSEPPQQIVNLELRALGDIVTNMVVTEEVRARFPALPRYGAVVIRCNDQEVGRVSPVVTASHPSEIPAPPPPPTPPPHSDWTHDPSRPPVPIPQPGPGGEPPPPDALGDVWEEEEENSWRGTWIRRGQSHLFDAYWVHPSGERVWAVLEIMNRGREVKVERRHPDGQGCSYRGTIAENWADVSGSYSCSWHGHTSQWRAQIVRMRDVSPALLSNGGWQRIR